MDIPSVIKSSVPKNVLKKKGDLVTAKDDGQLDSVSVGPDGTILSADSSQAAGFKWVPGKSSITTWGDIAGTLSDQADLEKALNDKEPANPNIQAHIATIGNPHGTTKTEIGLGKVTNEAQIPKNVGTAKGGLLAFSGPGLPSEVPIGKDNQVLTVDPTQPSGVVWKNFPEGTAAWGSIEGTLSNQDDLRTALDCKAPATSGKSVLKGDGAGGFADAAAGSDFLEPAGDGSRLTGITAFQVGLGNVPNIDPTTPANIKQDSTYRFVSDAEKSTWNAKQDSLGFEPVPDTRTVAGHPLTADVTISKSDLGLGNVPNLDTSNPANILQDSAHRFVSDSEKATWNSKQDALGCTPVPETRTVAGHALTSDLVISKEDVGLGNVPNLDTSNPANINQNSTHRFVSDAEKSAWNGKQDALGFTPVPNTLTVAGHPLNSDIAISKSDVGLGNVTNDAQLKAAAGDFASFNEKTSPVSADLLLIEDSTAGGAKKKVQVGNLPGEGNLPSQTGHAGQFLTTDGSSASWGIPAAGSAAWDAIANKPEITVGDTGFGTTIQAALAAIGANEKILVIPPGNYAGPATVPSNVTIRFARGALLTSGELTINGELQAGDYQILKGGTLVIGSTCRNEYVNPRWWGAQGDDDGAGSGTD
ncbi:MAG: hypothetical protein P8168_14105, partial [Deltaproteobacteria bacterium]